MSVLSRLRTFTRQKLLYSDLNAELNNIVDGANAFFFYNPAAGDLDMDSNYIENAKVKRWMHVRNAADFTTLNAAVDDLPADGGVVYLPPHQGGGTGGAYEISSAMTLVANTTIIGGGKDSIVKLTADPALTIFEASSISNVHFANLTIDGANLQTNQTGAISFTGSTDCSVVNCEIKNIGVDEITRGDGIIIDGGDRLWILNNYIHNVKRNGISQGEGGGADGTDLVIMGNVCESNYHAGISLEPLSSRTIVNGNICRSNGHWGIITALFSTNDVDHVVISNNHILDNGNSTPGGYATTAGGGIAVNGGAGISANLTNLNIIGNTIKDTGTATVAVNGFGISVNISGTGTAHRNWNVTNNTIETCDGEGIFVQFGPQAMEAVLVQVHGNMIYNPCRNCNDTRDCISIRAATSGDGKHISVCNNTILVTEGGIGNSPRFGIQVNTVDGSGGIIAGNYMDITNVAGGYIADINSNDPTIEMGFNRCASHRYNL
jgi:hypothetical protein